MAINKETQASASFVLDKETYDKFKEVCKSEKRSVSAQTALLIEKFLFEWENRY